MIVQRSTIARVGASFFPGLLLLAMALAIGCSTPSPTTRPQPVANLVPVRPLDQSVVLTLGDINEDEPTLSIKKLQPLADHLAANLHDQGVVQGRILIARNFEEMAQFLREGKVDIYLDSPYPSLVVQEMSGSKIIMRRWKQQDPTYWSTYIARRDSGIGKVEDFQGKVLAVEESYSTSGFLLPIGTLAQRGFSVKEVASPSDSVAPGEIGYYFARDEKNTVELVLRGDVAGGGVSNLDYEELPPELKEQLVAFDRTITVPRQLASARPGLDQGLVDQITQVMASVHETEQGRQVLAQASKTSRFDTPTPEDHASLEELHALMDLISK